MRTDSPRWSVPLLLFAAIAPAQTPRRIADLDPAGASAPVTPIFGTGPRQGELLFAADDGVHGQELWRTDGTAAGTSMVVDLTAGAVGTTFWYGASSPAAFWFVTGDFSPDQLWRTDGTAGGTVLVYQNPLGISPPEVWPGLGDLLFFNVGPFGGPGGQLARTDGTPAGTFLLPAPAAGVTMVRDGLAFLVTNDLAGDLVVSDGNTAVTVLPNANVRQYAKGRLVVELHTLVGSVVQATTLWWWNGPGAPSVTLPGLVTVALEGSDFFLLTDSQTLWRWDGTAPPVVLANLQPGFRLGAAQAPDHWVFVNSDAAHGLEVWSTDGTVAGTQVLDLTPGPASTDMIWIGSGLFWRDVPGLGSEPWFTDGTVAGTVLLGDLEPGPGSSAPDAQFLFASAAAPIGLRRILMPVTTSATGRELWLTDRTAAGSHFLPESLPGPQSSLGTNWWFPQWAGHSAIYFADDGVAGFEPWAIDFDGISFGPLPNVSYGGYPRLLFAEDPVLGANWTLRCTELAPQDLGLVLVGLPAALALPLGGGQFQFFDPAGSFALGNIAPDPAGNWQATLPLPNAPWLVGLDLVVQPVFVPSPQPSGLDFGNAIALTLGY